MEDITRRKFLAGTGAVAVLGPFSGRSREYESKGYENGAPEIIGHRGASGIHEDNSLEAINYCIESPNVDGIEVDLRVTKDDVVVLNHDPYVNGNSVMSVSRNTYHELEENTDTHLIKLPEYLDLMKSNSKNMYFGVKEESVIPRLNSLIGEFDVVDRTTIMSLDVDMLDYARRDCQILIAGAVPNYRLLRNSRRAHIDGILSYHMSSMTKQISKDAKREGLFFGVWFFVDTEYDVKDAFLYDLDYILTNNPRQTADVFKSL